MSTDHSLCRGRVAPGFEAVRTAFHNHFVWGWDLGAAFSVFLNGVCVVDLQGGIRDAKVNPPVPYDADTLQLVASVTKFAESLCIALLVDRQLLSYDDCIVDHWAEFASTDERKAQITVRQLMMHRAGLPVFDRPVTDAELFNVDALSAFLEHQTQMPHLFRAEPLNGHWQSQILAPPQAYHAISRGLYASELLRRVDPHHRTLGQFFQDELAEPLNLQFWIGLPDAELDRVAPPHPSDPQRLMAVLENQPHPDVEATDPRYQLDDSEREMFRQFLTQPESLPHRALNGLSFPGVPPQVLATHRKLYTCELPSSNGIGNARSIAKLAALAVGQGKLDDQPIFTHADTLQQMLVCADRYAVDGVMLTPISFTQGGLGRFVETDSQTVSVGWDGAGGQRVRFVPELALACAYVTNTMGVRQARNDPRPNALMKAAIACATAS